MRTVDERVLEALRACGGGPLPQSRLTGPYSPSGFSTVSMFHALDDGPGPGLVGDCRVWVVDGVASRPVSIGLGFIKQLQKRSSPTHRIHGGLPEVLTSALYRANRGVVDAPKP